MCLLLIIATASVVSAFTGTAINTQASLNTCARSATFIHASSSTSLPDLNYGLSDEEFYNYFMDEVKDCPGRQTYSSVFVNATQAIVQWRKRYRGNPLLWKRVFKKERVIKELVESAPVIESVMQVVASNQECEKFTIIDLCSGKGYLSMFLSEVLPKEKVERFILVDKAWAIASKDVTTELKPHHMNWNHIYGTNPLSDESYFTTWPIPLYTSKQDLKQSCNQRQMKKHIFGKSNGPVIVLAVHLCGTLSIKAVEMFNNNENVKLFVLKPCCLPPMIHSQRGEIFRIGNHEFDAKDVCSNGSFNKKSWTGPPRWHLQPKFDRWAEDLFKGIDIGIPSWDIPTTYENRVMASSENGSKAKDEIKIQVDGGFQNTYIFAERQPLTSAIWGNCSVRLHNI
ncbi:hypothetical protein ACHAXR_004540 [Thalassiosira sp. AJA248-18]